MYLYSVKGDKLNIQCDGCEKIYVYSQKYFSYVSESYCINNTLLQCKTCGRSAYPNTKIFAKKEISDRIKYSTSCQSTSTEKKSGVTKDIKVTILSWAVVIGLVALVWWGLSTIASFRLKDNIYTQEHFEDMMHRDPSTWTKEEREYYYNFRKWSDENNGD
jgi:hypothetical protein